MGDKLMNFQNFNIRGKLSLNVGTSLLRILRKIYNFFFKISPNLLHFLDLNINTTNDGCAPCIKGLCMRNLWEEAKNSQEPSQDLCKASIK